eukprot:3769695-Amphidinium_carterae.1
MHHKLSLQVNWLENLASPPRPDTSQGDEPKSLQRPKAKKLIAVRRGFASNKLLSSYVLLSWANGCDTLS